MPCEDLSVLFGGQWKLGFDPRQCPKGLQYTVIGRNVTSVPFRACGSPFGLCQFERLFEFGDNACQWLGKRFDACAQCAQRFKEGIHEVSIRVEHR